MKKLFASFGWILLLLPLISVAGARTAFQTSKNAAFAETRQVSAFSGITLTGPLKVYVKFGPKAGIRLEGNKETLKGVQTKVVNGVLNIQSNISKALKSKVKIYITAVSLNSITTNGSGDIEVDGAISSPKIQTKVIGPGSISLYVTTKSYSAVINGSGKITVIGATQTADIQVNGPGEFMGRDFVVDNSTVKVNSGSASIIAQKSLNASINGSGRVSYRGNGKLITNKPSRVTHLIG